MVNKDHAVFRNPRNDDNGAGVTDEFSLDMAATCRLDLKYVKLRDIAAEDCPPRNDTERFLTLL